MAELVRLEQDEQAAKLAKKESVAEMNAGLKQTRASIDKLVKELDEGAEVREVEVETRYDYAAKAVEYVRCDTQEIIASREMDSFDLQESLPEDVLPPPQRPQKRQRRKHGTLTDADLS
jgi:hypothetical protein